MKTDARLGLKSHIDNKAALTESGCSARGFTLRSRKTIMFSLNGLAEVMKTVSPARLASDEALTTSRGGLNG